MYDYRDAMHEDIINAVKNYDLEQITDRDELTERLNDLLWINDSVTGNASGSYFCNSWKARECVIDNMDLLQEMAREFDQEEETGRRLLNEEWEWCDVSIRCYLLGECIEAAADEIMDQIN